ncbi:MAG: hypothetical protein WA778_20450, partial [Pseudolabrys sp.]
IASMLFMACLETWTFADAVAMSGKCQQRALPRVCANTRLDLFEPPVDCRFIPDHEGPILRSRLISHVDQSDNHVDPQRVECRSRCRHLLLEVLFSESAFEIAQEISVT